MIFNSLQMLLVHIDETWNSLDYFSCFWLLLIFSLIFRKCLELSNNSKLNSTSSKVTWNFRDYYRLTNLFHCHSPMNFSSWFHSQQLWLIKRQKVVVVDCLNQTINIAIWSEFSCIKSEWIFRKYIVSFTFNLSVAAIFKNILYVWAMLK